MKSASESILFSIAILLFSFLVTPLVHQNQNLSYFLVVVAVIFLALGLSLRLKRHQEEQNNLLQAFGAIMTQQKTLAGQLQNSVMEQVDISVEKLLEAKRVELKSAQKREEQAGVFYNDSLKHLSALGDHIIESSGKIVGVIEDAHLTSKAQNEQQLSESKRLIEYISSLDSKLTEQSDRFLEAFAISQTSFEQNFRGLNQQLAEQHIKAIDSIKEIVTILKLRKSEANDFYGNQLTESKGIKDSINDLESKLAQQSNTLLDSLADRQQALEGLLEEIKDRYSEFNDNIEEYQKTVRRASEDIEFYGNDIEENLKDRLESLQFILSELKELTAQLADSKYPEREKALEVQKKLTKQFERLMEREFVHSSKD